MSVSDDIGASLMRALSKAGATGDTPLAVAFSGGADSTALLVAACATGRDVTALHCNFHLRGAESDRDEQFCRRLAATLGVELRVKHFDVHARMAATGESLEMAARELRYAWFDSEERRLCAEKGAAMVPLLVAHHADDNVETFMLNLMRGSGLRGLAAIPPRRGYIVRPLLGITRKDILEYLREQGVEYVTDSSNLVADVMRNKLRLKVLPAMEELFPGFSRAVGQSAQHLRDDLELLQSLTDGLRSRCEAPGGWGIDIKKIAAEPCAASLLYHILGGALHRHTVERILASTDASGKIFEGSGGARWLLDRGVLRPVEAIEADERPQAPRIEAGLLPVEAFAPTSDPTVMWLDADALPADARWELRPWRHGDRISPFGMKGSRAVSSLLAEARVPLTEKGGVWLLQCNGVTLWVIGLRTSRHFAVTKNTRRVWRLEAKIGQ